LASLESSDLIEFVIPTTFDLGIQQAVEAHVLAMSDKAINLIKKMACGGAVKGYDQGGGVWDSIESAGVVCAGFGFALLPEAVSISTNESASLKAGNC